MAKKWTGALLVILALAGAAAYWYLVGKTYELRITQAQLEQKLADKLPLTRSYPLWSVTLDRPRLHLNEESDRIQLGLDVTLALQAGAIRPPMQSEIDLSAGISYDQQLGAFFLTDPVIERLRLEGVEDKRMNVANVVLSKAIAAYFRERPIYTLSSSDQRQRLARMVLQQVKVENGGVVIVMGL